jgi:hypothetical protein
LKQNHRFGATISSPSLIKGLRIDQMLTTSSAFRETGETGVRNRRNREKQGSEKQGSVWTFQWAHKVHTDPCFGILG